MLHCFAMAVFERPLSSQCCSNTSVSWLRTDLLPRQKEVKVRRWSSVRHTLTRGLPTVQFKSTSLQSKISTDNFAAEMRGSSAGHRADRSVRTRGDGAASAGSDFWGVGARRCVRVIDAHPKRPWVRDRRFQLAQVNPRCVRLLSACFRGKALVCCNVVCLRSLSRRANAENQPDGSEVWMGSV